MISIIIPVFNADHYLEACLNSVLSQDFKNIEIIAIDDGSTDESQKILTDVASRDPRLIVLQQENAGPSVARNRGLDQAKGDYIFFLDADDTLAPGSLANLNAESSDADLIIGRFQKLDLDGNTISGFEPCSAGQKSTDDLVSLARAYLVAPNRHLTFAYAWGRLFKATLIKANHLRFDESMRSYEDVKFNFEFLGHCRSVYVSDTPTYRFLVRTDHSSLTFEIGNDPARLLGYNHAIRSIEGFIRQASPQTDASAEIARAMVSLSVIQSIRICVNLNWHNFGTIYTTLKQLLADSLLRQSLRLYQVEPGHSRLIPFLMKRGWVLPLMLTCARRGWQRYGKKT
ncbi:MAG: glycosyltransferase family 2 protein [Gammaproteobacteria bacterium]|jgi:glycosyltransferase involved in cell wall biosynthesis|nr:glycosyltransferase family 2 protein [Gammaproteobacteria bacterium]MBT4492576.1 glycosyltransferase family 2 protein [Gammaproteobacteria bacterium]